MNLCGHVSLGKDVLLADEHTQKKSNGRPRFAQQKILAEVTGSCRKKSGLASLSKDVLLAWNTQKRVPGGLVSLDSCCKKWTCFARQSGPVSYWTYSKKEYRAASLRSAKILAKLICFHCSKGELASLGRDISVCV